MYYIKHINIRKIRYHFQWALFFITIFAGVRFYLFYRHFTSMSPFVERPTLVDGFLPIGALLSFKLWIKEGILHPVHPAAAIILLSALTVSLLFKKSFCGWICPIGTVSELIYKTGSKIFGKNYRIHPYLDILLRSIKYIFLGFTLYLSFLKLNVIAIKVFLNTEYWKIADVKMLLLFINMSKVTLIVLTSLFIFSLFFKNFWCRYLCPYGALTGLLSMLSPFMISRNKKTCLQCDKCTQICPNQIQVSKKSVINSPECNGCQSCISVCPSQGTLGISLLGKRAINSLIYGLFVYICFFLIIGVARVTDNWKANISYSEYREIIPSINRIGH